MPLFGNVVLLAAFVASIWAILASLLGAYSRSAPLVQSGERAAIATWGLVILAAITLVVAFLNRRRMGGRDVEVDHAPPLMRQNEEAAQEAERGGGEDEEVAGSSLPAFRPHTVHKYLK